MFWYLQRMNIDIILVLICHSRKKEKRFDMSLNEEGKRGGGDKCVACGNFESN